MLRELTQEESAIKERRINEYLLSLDSNTKSHLVSLLNPLTKQANCNHNWIDLDSYENEMPPNSLFCNKCQLIKRKDGI